MLAAMGMPQMQAQQTPAAGPCVSPFHLFQTEHGYPCPLEGCACVEARPSELMLHMTVQKRHPQLDLKLFRGKRVNFSQRLPDCADGIPAYVPHKHGFIGSPNVVFTS